MSTLAYRPEIDGMRALAVGGVVLFHMGVPFIGGGFAGVDVFFVISGFLITSLIDAEMREGRFSFAAFYERRIRRLLPPLVPVLLATWLISYALLNVWQFADFARSLRATLALSANWHFFATVGYFDGPAETKPLLHFWSLAVEEQFYLAFPILLLALWRIAPRSRLAVTSALGVASLAFNAYLVATGKSDSAFFNSLARFWEILAGAGLALSTTRVDSHRLANIVELLGFGALALLFAYSDAARSPMQTALVAVAGTTFLIIGNGRGAIVSPMLKSRLFVATGKISYALYLWHWPIIVVLRLAYPDAGFEALAAGMALATGLSVLSYWTLEKPFRERRVLPRRRWVFALLVASTLAFGALSVSNYLPGISGFKASLSVAMRGALYGPEVGAALFALDEAGGEVARYDVYFDGSSGPFDTARHSGLPCSLDNGNTVERILACLVEQAHDHNVLLIGDSIGRDTLHALRMAFPEVNFLMLHQSSCPPVDKTWPGQHCFANLDAIVERAAATLTVDAIILAYRHLPESWSVVGPTLKLAHDLSIPAASMGVSPVFTRTLTEFLKSLPHGAPVPLELEKSDKRMFGWNLGDLASEAANLTEAHGATFINVSSHFCPRSCPLWLDDDRAQPIFWDAQHLTVAGIQAFGKYLSSHAALIEFLKQVGILSSAASGNRSASQS